MAKANDKDGVDGLNMNSSVNREAYREMRVAQETRASQQGDTSPDTAEAMGKQFSKQDNERSAEVDNLRASQNRAAYVKSQRDYFNSMSEGMSSQGMIDRGGVQIGSVQQLGDGAAGIIPAGGERKGGHTSLGSGAAGIVAAGGAKKGIELGINSSFRDQLNAATWGSGMQKYRTLVRQYQRKEREKKKNDGGLTAARQTHAGKDFFPHRPMFKVGAVTFTPMKFDGVTPMVGTYKAAQEGWPTGDENALNRAIRQAGRNYRSSVGI